MEKQEEVRVAWGTGIAGHVAESGEPVNIPDAYQVRAEWRNVDGSFRRLNDDSILQDERFNRDIDVQTGYRTKALLCMPIKDASGDVIGVAQVINKLNFERFSENDEKVTQRGTSKISHYRRKWKIFLSRFSHHICNFAESA